MLYSRAWIAAHIPHQGSMCLLEGVLAFDENHITCLIQSHQSPTNPLRAEGRLGISTGVEYAAQAAATHCALLATLETTDAQTASATRGYIAAVRGVENHCTRLDQLSGNIQVLADRVAALPGGAMYAFSLNHNDHVLQTGRFTLMFDPQPSSTQDGIQS